MKIFNNISSNAWNSGSHINDYYCGYTYDANGNITTLYRNGASSVNINMDALTYHYYNGTNRLEYVDDAVAAGNYTTDIDAQLPGNYTYDAIGNLVSDEAEEIAEIEWNVYGKVKKVTRDAGSSKPHLEFKYDATGNRVVKIEKRDVSDITTWRHEYYARDAQGNVIAIYQRTFTGNTAPYHDEEWKLAEQNMYGSSRLGVYQPGKVLEENEVHLSLSSGEISSFTFIGNTSVYAKTDTSYYRFLGQKKYELSNHLGNVMVVVYDRRTAVDNGGGGVAYFEAEVYTAYDYYPFGSIMPERFYSINEQCSIPEWWEVIVKEDYEIVITLDFDLEDGEEFLIEDAVHGFRTLAFYLGDMQAFIDEIITNGNYLDGFYFTQTGSNEITIHVNMTDGGYNCGDIIYFNIGSMQYSLEIDCDETTIHHPASGCGPEDYRYGFNNMEKDNEMKGVGNSLDFGARIYDSRLGRWLSLDKLYYKYPDISPYVFGANNPIYFIDPDGNTIEPMPSFQNTRHELVFNKLRTSSNIFQTMIKAYEGATGNNIQLHFSDSDGKKGKYAHNNFSYGFANDRWHISSKIYFYPHKMIFEESNPNYANNGYMNDLGIAVSIVHEAMHSFLKAQGHRGKDHDLMASDPIHFQAFSNMISSFAETELGITLSPENLIDLYWDGLTDTKAYSDHKLFNTPEKQEKHQDRVRALMYKIEKYKDGETLESTTGDYYMED